MLLWERFDRSPCFVFCWSLSQLSKGRTGVDSGLFTSLLQHHTTVYHYIHTYCKFRLTNYPNQCIFWTVGGYWMTHTSMRRTCKLHIERPHPWFEPRTLLCVQALHDSIIQLSLIYTPVWNLLRIWKLESVDRLSTKIFLKNGGKVKDWMGQSQGFRVVLEKFHIRRLSHTTQKGSLVWNNYGLDLIQTLKIPF